MVFVVDFHSFPATNEAQLPSEIRTTEALVTVIFPSCKM